MIYVGNHPNIARLVGAYTAEIQSGKFKCRMQNAEVEETTTIAAKTESLCYIRQWALVAETMWEFYGWILFQELLTLLSNFVLRAVWKIF